MTHVLICHFLIGLPASGKSTLARRLQEITPNATIVSTDTARKKLFRDEKIQGNWADEVEPEVLEQIKNAIAHNNSVIYDATNVKRDWRIGMLMKIKEKLQQINAPPICWIAWHLQTPVGVCKKWNQKRDRQVPNEVIEEYSELLKQFPPQIEEGFKNIYKLPLR